MGAASTRCASIRRPGGVVRLAWEAVSESASAGGGWSDEEEGGRDDDGESPEFRARREAFMRSWWGGDGGAAGESSYRTHRAQPPAQRELSRGMYGFYYGESKANLERDDSPYAGYSDLFRPQPQGVPRALREAAERWRGSVLRRWLASLDAVALSDSHAVPPAPARDPMWNERMQRLFEVPAAGPTERHARDAAVRALVDEFVGHARGVAVVIVDEMGSPDERRSVPPLRGGPGVAGGEKFMHGGVFYKLARDHMGIYGGSDRLAQKAASNEVRGAGCVAAAGVEGVHASLVAVFYVRGHVVSAAAAVPISGRRTLVAGSDNAGASPKQGRRVLNGSRDPIAGESLRQLAEAAGLAPHHIEDARGLQRIYLAVDVEAHRSLRDGRLYVVDTARMMPALPPRIPAGDDERQRYRGDFLTRLFRPEALALLPEPLSADAFSLFGAHGQLEHNSRARAAHETLLREQVPAAADALAARSAGGAGLAPAEVSELLHAHGLNVHMAGEVRAQCQPAAADALMDEMVCRAFKTLVRGWLRRTRSAAQAAELLARAVCVFFGVPPEASRFGVPRADSEALWDSALAARVLDKFGAHEELDLARGVAAVRDRVLAAPAPPRGPLALRLLLHLDADAGGGRPPAVVAEAEELAAAVLAGHALVPLTKVKRMRLPPYPDREALEASLAARELVLGPTHPALATALWGAAEARAPGADAAVLVERLKALHAARSPPPDEAASFAFHTRAGRVLFACRDVAGAERHWSAAAAHAASMRRSLAALPPRRSRPFHAREAAQAEATALVNWAAAANASGRSADEAATLARAVDVARSQPGVRCLPVALSRHAAALGRAGRTEEQVAALVEALDAAEPVLAAAWRAHVHGGRGATSSLSDAADELVAGGGMPHPSAGLILAALAGAAARSGLAPPAARQDAAAAACVLASAARGRAHADTVAALRELAAERLAAGDPASSEAAASRAAQAARDARGAGSPLEAACLVDLAAAHAAAGRAPEHESCLSRAERAVRTAAKAGSLAAARVLASALQAKTAGLAAAGDRTGARAAAREGRAALEALYTGAPADDALLAGLLVNEAGACDGMAERRGLLRAALDRLEAAGAGRPGAFAAERANAMANLGAAGDDGDDGDRLLAAAIELFGRCGAGESQACGLAHMHLALRKRPPSAGVSGLLRAREILSRRVPPSHPALVRVVEELALREMAPS